MKSNNWEDWVVQLNKGVIHQQMVWELHKGDSKTDKKKKLTTTMTLYMLPTTSTSRGGMYKPPTKDTNAMDVD